MNWTARATRLTSRSNGKYVDDSFDGHLYGRVHTFEEHHWEPENWEVIWIEDEEGNSVDETPAITKFIASEVDDLEYND